MTLRMVVRAPSVSAESAAMFRSDARLVFGIYNHLRRNTGIPGTAITAILADDFAGEVNQHSPAFVTEPFDPVRVGGEAAAKNLQQSDDASSVVIVFAARHWCAEVDGIGRLSNLYVTAHELAHPMLTRASHVSGAMDGVELPSITPHEGARSGARIMAGEYRADILAEAILGSMGTAEVGGVTRGSNTWLFRGETYLAGLGDVLGAAHPSWPDTVDRYRDHEISLDEMWPSIARSLDQTLTMLIHGQAAADAAETGIDLLRVPEIAALPAVRLYLADVLDDFITSLRATPAVLPLKDAKAAEDAYTQVGAEMHLEIWKRLGIRPRDLPRPQVYLDISAPLR
jgi:hypothetical protein